jgi:hypothetical protein
VLAGLKEEWLPTVSNPYSVFFFPAFKFVLRLEANFQRQPFGIFDSLDLLSSTQPFQQFEEDALTLSPLIFFFILNPPRPNPVSSSLSRPL